MNPRFKLALLTFFAQYYLYRDLSGMSAAKPLQVFVTVSTPGPAGAPQCTEFTFGAAERQREATDASPFSFAYTGQHDGGALLPPREGPYRDLAATLVEEAKTSVDAFLKSMLNEGSAAGSASAATNARSADAK